jgi:hypothetical protein
MPDRQVVGYAGSTVDKSVLLVRVASSGGMSRRLDCALRGGWRGVAEVAQVVLRARRHARGLGDTRGIGLGGMLGRLSRRLDCALRGGWRGVAEVAQVVLRARRHARGLGRVANAPRSSLSCS